MLSSLLQDWIVTKGPAVCDGAPCVDAVRDLDLNCADKRYSGALTGAATSTDIVYFFSFLGQFVSHISGALACPFGPWSGVRMGLAPPAVRCSQ